MGRNARRDAFFLGCEFGLRGRPSRALSKVSRPACPAVAAQYRTARRRRQEFSETGNEEEVVSYQ
jgi:hypothetical protein